MGDRWTCPRCGSSSWFTQDEKTETCDSCGHTAPKPGAPDWAEEEARLRAEAERVAGRVLDVIAEDIRRPAPNIGYLVDALMAALRSAEQRGREAGLEEAAKVADAYVTWERTDLAQIVAAAIRKRGAR